MSVVASCAAAAVLLVAPMSLPFEQRPERDPRATGAHGYMLVCPLREADR